MTEQGNKSHEITYLLTISLKHALKPFILSPFFFILSHSIRHPEVKARAAFTACSRSPRPSSSKDLFVHKWSTVGVWAKCKAENFALVGAARLIYWDVFCSDAQSAALKVWDRRRGGNLKVKMQMCSKQTNKQTQNKKSRTTCSSDDNSAPLIFACQ